MTDIEFLAQIGTEFGGLASEPNAFANGYKIKAECVASAVREISRLRDEVSVLTISLRDRDGFITKMADICRGRKLA